MSLSCGGVVGLSLPCVGVVGLSLACGGVIGLSLLCGGVVGLSLPCCGVVVTRVLVWCKWFSRVVALSPSCGRDSSIAMEEVCLICLVVVSLMFLIMVISDYFSHGNMVMVCVCV